MKRIAASFVLVGVLSTSAMAGTTDTFSSSGLSGYVTGGRAGWFIDDGRLAHTYSSNMGTVEMVRRADIPHAEADLTLSSGRSNAGLTVLWKDRNNHLWAKLEISPGNPAGLMTIGRERGGNGTSLLAVSRGGLKAGETYHVSLAVEDGVARFTATGTSVSFFNTITYRLSPQDVAAFGSGEYAGVRAKYLFDEDDGGSRWDNLTV
ncbi:MAG: hypothetical protein ABI572_09895 [Actinomycetota bacterium]